MRIVNKKILETGNHCPLIKTVVIMAKVNSPGEPYSCLGNLQILGITSIKVFTY